MGAECAAPRFPPAGFPPAEVHGLLWRDAILASGSSMILTQHCRDSASLVGSDVMTAENTSSSIQGRENATFDDIGGEPHPIQGRLS